MFFVPLLVKMKPFCATNRQLFCIVQRSRTVVRILLETRLRMHLFEQEGTEETEKDNKHSIACYATPLFITTLLPPLPPVQ